MQTPLSSAVAGGGEDKVQGVVIIGLYRPRTECYGEHMNPEGLNRQPQETHGLLSRIVRAEQRLGNKLVYGVLAANIGLILVHDSLAIERQQTETAIACSVADCGRIALDGLIAMEGVPPLSMPSPFTAPKPERPSPQPVRTPVAKTSPIIKPPQLQSYTEAPAPKSTLARSHSLARDLLWLPPGTAGMDVAWPQCPYVANLPPVPKLAIIGISDYDQPNYLSSCLDSPGMLDWANKAVEKQFYLGASNFDKGGSGKNWPTSNADITGAVPPNPYGICRGEGSPACAFVSGFNLARTQSGLIMAKAARVHWSTNPRNYQWWVDVEPGFPWSVSQDNNLAAVEGTVFYFQVIHAPVGLYSIANLLQEVVGPHVRPNSNLNGLPSWIVRTHLSRDPRAYCNDPPLTPGGLVVMVQYQPPDKKLDYNITCVPVPVLAKAR